MEKEQKRSSLIQEGDEIYVYRLLNGEIYVYKAVTLVPYHKMYGYYYKNRVRVKEVIRSKKAKNTTDAISIPVNEFECKNNTIWSYKLNLERAKEIFIKQKQEAIDELKKSISRLEKEIELMRKA